MTKTNTEETKVEEVVEAKETKAKKTVYKITASYRVKNEEENVLEKISHTGIGLTPQEAIADITDYPKGLNCNVKVAVTHGDNFCEKNLAPHVAKAIMERADMLVFEKQFRGI